MTDIAPEPPPSELLLLLASGVDIEAAGTRLGISASSVRDLMAAEAAARDLGPDVERRIEVTHLDVLRRALLPRLLVDGNPKAAWALIGVHRARAALLGLTPAPSVVQAGEGQPNELSEIRARRRTRLSSLEGGG